MGVILGKWKRTWKLLYRVFWVQGFFGFRVARDPRVASNSLAVAYMFPI